jgi:hypothetical protein
MAGNEDEAKEIVADLVVERCVEVRRDRFLHRELAAELFMLTFEELVPAELIDRTVLRGCHQPGAWPLGDARCRPLLQRRDESILRKLLRDADVADHPRKAGDELRPLDPPDCVDGTMCLGSRHGYRSDHFRARRSSYGGPGSEPAWSAAQCGDAAARITPGLPLRPGYAACALVGLSASRPFRIFPASAPPARGARA